MQEKEEEKGRKRREEREEKKREREERREEREEKKSERGKGREKKTPHSAAYPRALFTTKDAPSEPLRNPPSCARKLPVFTELSHF